MNRIQGISLLLAFAIGFAIPRSSSCSLGPNLIANGGFENTKEEVGTPEGWGATRVPQTADYVSLEVVDSCSYSGDYSAFIEIDSGHPIEIELDPYYVPNKIAYCWSTRTSECRPGRLYVLSGWIKTQDLNSPAFLMVQCLADSTDFQVLKFVYTSDETPVSGTSDWTRVATVFNVPENTAGVRVMAGISSPKHIGGQVWFDNVEIRELR